METFIIPENKVKDRVEQIRHLTSAIVTKNLPL